MSLFFKPVFEHWTGGEATPTNRTGRQKDWLIQPSNWSRSYSPAPLSNPACDAMRTMKGVSIKHIGGGLTRSGALLSQVKHVFNACLKSLFTCGEATQVNKWCNSSRTKFKNFHQVVWNYIEIINMTPPRWSGSSWCTTGAFTRPWGVLETQNLVDRENWPWKT